MSIDTLNITHFRNITEASLTLHPSLNLFYGENGSGKTSLLEALYYLGYARSFRTHKKAALIQRQQQSFTLHALLHDHLKQPHSMGIERHQSLAGRTQIDGEAACKGSQMAALLPLKVITAQNYRLLTDGPQARRRYLDWGMFHVKHAFLKLAQQYQKALNQRNRLLKTRRPTHEMDYWTDLCAQTGSTLDNMRQSYFKSLMTHIHSQAESMAHPDLAGLHIEYDRGWDGTQSLATCLNQQHKTDLRTGFTQSGPHRADLIITLNGHAVHESCSQGQLKLLAYLLQLAQGEQLSEEAAKPTLYLIDDIGSDFDARNTQLMLKQLLALPSQRFITSICGKELKLLQDHDHALFHVKQGLICKEATGLPA